MIGRTAYSRPVARGARIRLGYRWSSCSAERVRYSTSGVLICWTEPRFSISSLISRTCRRNDYGAAGWQRPKRVEEGNRERDSIRDTFHERVIGGVTPSRSSPGAPIPTSSCPSHLRCLLRLPVNRSEEHTSELQSLRHLVCRLL